ncbi:MAG TPA: hypothetical protein VLW50_04925 [Streptosporangiaceae bacterium]|nr:hypothetical protein [Streptosporangiaceae bacterium]
MRDYPIYSAIILGALVLLGCWRAWDAAERVGAALWVFAAAAAAFSAGQFFVAPRARPSLRDVQPGVSVLYHAVSGFPPPSGTAAMAGAVAGGLFFVHRRSGIAAVVATATMAMFQVCVVAYSWQDVTAGLVFGVAIVLGGYAVLADALTRVGRFFVRLAAARPGRAPVPPGS